jgi:frataxin
MIFNFEKTSDICLNSIYQFIEGIVEINKDAEINFDLDNGVLQIDFVINSKNYSFVINKNSASQKIWYSSPVSKPKYYLYDQYSQNWTETSTSNFLITDFKQDLQKCGIATK